MTVKRVGLVVHRGRPEAVAAADVVTAWCAENDIACTETDVWNLGEQRHSAREEVDAAGHPDLIVTLGGDGTFLRGARLAAESDAVVLGVDLGTVGFLTEVPAADVRRALDAVHAGRARVETRMLLTMRASRRLQLPQEMETVLCYGRGPMLPPPVVPDESDQGGWGVSLHVRAVNDVVVEKLVRDRQVALGVYVSGRLLASYSADAVLVATPTGSTAYSFAAGGPVVSPFAEAVVFTPVAPHMTFNRSVVAAPDEPIGLRVLPHSGRAAVSVDGQLRGLLDPGDWIGVFAAERRLRVIRFGPTDFYGRLRDRMGLTDAPAAAAAGDPARLWPASEPVPADLQHLRLPPGYDV
ncbi:MULTISPECIES: NAD(+)/NADH kinase [unclassified Streptomyces]|uniref:NAD(+)/NADH kinase n=1 Tax=unclassified Streptomyces TaxID=2593676 RepID=UPI0028C48192|nr:MULTISPECIES: NAD(+)/NADH kinase [unclassified Streptomyces]WNO70747.1 NAD(+)/NADH kinase [Streptomyces sp. AM8-1-1]